jgi:hypothetical protein
MRVMLEARVMARLTGDAAVRKRIEALEDRVAAGEVAPMVAVDEIAGLIGV